MERLPEEILEEIFTRMPLKYAIRCKSLKKIFNSIISNPSFPMKHAVKSSQSTNYSSILHVTKNSYPKLFVNLLFLDHIKYRQIHVILPNETRVLSCSNGLFLLQVIDRNHLYLLNPITKICKVIPLYANPIQFMVVGLAVNYSPSLLPSSSSCCSNCYISLVEIYIKAQDLVFRYTLGFRIFKQGNWVDSNETVNININDGSNSKLFIGDQSIYLNGCLYWLCNKGFIIEFDLNREKSRYIKIQYQGLSIGVVNGMLYVIFKSKKSGFIVHCNYEKQEWRFEARFEIEDKDDFPILYDGKQLFVRRFENDEQRSYICACDKSKKEEQKIAYLYTFLDHSRDFIPFYPTLLRFDYNEEEDQYHDVDNDDALLQLISSLFC